MLIDLSLLFPSGTPRARPLNDRAKLHELLEAVFEAIDELPHPIPDGMLSLGTHPYLSRVSSADLADRRPLLNSSTLRKITKLLGTVGGSREGAAPGRHDGGKAEKRRKKDQERVMQDGKPAELSGPIWWGSEMEEGSGEKLMTLLVGAMMEGKEVFESGGSLWANSARSTSVEKVLSETEEGTSADTKGGAKGKVKKARRTNLTALGAADQEEETDVLLDRLEKKLEIAVEAGLAADCVLVMLAGDGVPKQVRSLCCVREVATWESPAIQPRIRVLISLFVVLVSILALLRRDYLAVCSGRQAAPLGCHLPVGRSIGRAFWFVK